jgi:hypothetical protein
MNQEKYIGMDVHAATISAAVRNAEGKLLMECVLETKAARILEFIEGLRGTLALTFEEGTLAAWLHDLLKPQVSRLVVCDARKNALLRDGNQNDRVDARNLAELLRTHQVKPVYHEEHGIRTLKELGRSYSTLTQDSTRVMNRIKSVYRSWAIPCVRGKLHRNRERITVRGLNRNHNHDLKNLFKGAALSASTRPGPLCDFYVALVEKGMRPSLARLTLARKMAAITLTMWKKGVSFDPKQLQRQAA